jgi:hypothetical protein
VLSKPVGTLPTAERNLQPATTCNHTWGGDLSTADAFAVGDAFDVVGRASRVPTGLAT